MYPLTLGLVIGTKQLWDELQECIRELPVRVLLEQTSFGPWPEFTDKLEQTRPDLLVVDLAQVVVQADDFQPLGVRRHHAPRHEVVQRGAPQHRLLAAGVHGDVAADAGSFGGRRVDREHEAGALCGVASGVAIGAAWIPGFARVMPGLTFHFPGTTALAVAIAAIVLGTLAAILPARRAARLKVIEALSYE